MTRCNNLVLCAVMILGLTSVSRNAIPQHTVNEQLVGTWTLVSATVERDGRKIEAFGDNPLGYMIFTASGHFSWNFMRADRPKFASNNRQTGTPEENKAAVQAAPSTVAGLGGRSFQRKSLSSMRGRLPRARASARSKALSHSRMPFCLCVIIAVLETSNRPWAGQWKASLSKSGMGNTSASASQIGHGVVVSLSIRESTCY